MVATLTPPPQVSLPDRARSGGDRRALPLPMTPVALGAWTLSVVGLVLLAFVGFLLLGSSVQANRAQDVAYTKIRQQLADGVAPVSGVIAAGTPIGVLDIPALDLHQALLQGSTSEQTSRGPGLKSDTPFPGATGSSLVVGRRATFGAPFRHLGHLQVGDEVSVSTGLGKAVFRVDVVRHSDDPASTIANAASRITLVTSDPALTPTRQIVVSAVRIGTPYPAASTPVARDAEAPGQRTWGKAVFVLLWTQLLLVVAWASTRLGLRFGYRAVWIGAVPVVLLVLWNLFEGVAVLLPNTL
ncbi:MAG: sortase domain-bontaining protein [Marmoricola sp.]